MNECSRRGGFFFGISRDQGLYSSRVSAVLAFLMLALFLALPARADDDPPPPCPDGDGDGYVQCTGSCTIPGGKLCGDPDDGDARIHPGAPCGLCNGDGCPISSFCVPGSAHLPCPDPTTGGNHTEATSFCMNVNSPLIGVCSNNAAQTHDCAEPALPNVRRTWTADGSRGEEGTNLSTGVGDGIPSTIRGCQRKNQN